MRNQGRLTEWNDDRGFGFITPLDGAEGIFVHASAFPRDRRRPIVLDLVSYAIGRDERGRTRATDVLFMTPTSTVNRAPAAGASSATRRLRALGIAPAAALLLAGVAVAALAANGMFSSKESPTPAPVGVTDEAAVVAPPERTSTQDAVVAEPEKTLKERHPELSEPSGDDANEPQRSAAAGDDVIGDAFRNGDSGAIVTGTGTVTRVLPDDVDGSRHQRFILRLASGQTLLVAHNIDIASRLSGLDVGDTVTFKGEYEWNGEGGVIHWTHHDPQGTHTDGWLKHEGQTSQ